jgi:hypothetical protein
MAVLLNPHEGNNRLPFMNNTILFSLINFSIRARVGASYCSSPFSSRRPSGTAWRGEEGREEGREGRDGRRRGAEEGLERGEGRRKACVMVVVVARARRRTRRSRRGEMEAVECGRRGMVV